jgi:hypothetical protein
VAVDIAATSSSGACQQGRRRWCRGPTRATGAGRTPGDASPMYGRRSPAVVNSSEEPQITGCPAHIARTMQSRRSGASVPHCAVGRGRASLRRHSSPSRSEGSGAVACEQERLDGVLGYRAEDVSVDLAQRRGVKREPVGLDPVDAGDAGVAAQPNDGRGVRHKHSVVPGPQPPIAWAEEPRARRTSDLVDSDWPAHRSRHHRAENAADDWPWGTLGARTDRIQRSIADPLGKRTPW